MQPILDIFAEMIGIAEPVRCLLARFILLGATRMLGVEGVDAEPGGSVFLPAGRRISDSAVNKEQMKACINPIGVEEPKSGRFFELLGSLPGLPSIQLFEENRLSFSFPSHRN